jgi:hypothetical protein
MLCMVLGTFTVYFTLFSVGYWIYGRYLGATALTVLALAAAVYLYRLWGQLKTSVADEEHEVMPDRA